MKSRIQILALALLLSLVSVIPAGCGSGQTDEHKTPTESGITESLEERSEGGESSSSSTPTEKSTPEAPSSPSAGDNSELRSENSISSSGSAEEQTPEDEVSPDQSSMINEISEGSNSVSETEESTVKASEVSTVKQDSSDSVSESESKSPEFSEVSVEKSKKLNQEFIDMGIVNVLQGSVSEMPFYDETFDIVTGFETIYFWPDFINDLKEVNRVLKKDGLVFFCNEAVYREGEMDKYDDLVELLDMKIYSEDVLRESLEKTGFKDFKAYVDDEHDWICVTARKI